MGFEWDEDSGADKLYLQILYDGLLKGDGSLIRNDTIEALNIIAMKLYHTKELNENDVECMKTLLMICNVLYNRTDLDVLPIEDGVYDLLLEKYKEYEPNFQVGSAVVYMKNMVEKDPDFKETKQAIYLLEDPKPKDELSESIAYKIQDANENMIFEDQRAVNFRDLVKNPIYEIPGYINKRTHNTKHNHPSLVGTLDKCKFVLIQDAIDAGCIDDPSVKILERDFFQAHINAGIINPNDEYGIMLELKYDGISVEADCTNIVESARTRGDTGVGEASDITPILAGYSFPHARSRIGEPPIGVKFEAIMTKTALDKFCEVRGQKYVNCRTAIIGLFGNSDAYKYRDFITLIPLALDADEMPDVTYSRNCEINYLNTVFRSHGEPLRHMYWEGRVDQLLFVIKKYLEEAEQAREYLNFQYDGIVVSYVDHRIREKLGRVNFVNKYSMAVKFNPMTKTTSFRGYTYEVGQNGNITPMLHYDPVEFLGTIHTKCSGASLARFRELNLKYGDHIDVTYRNDVMPYVTKPDCEYNRNNPNPVIEPPDKCPVCGTNLMVSDSGKTLFCPNINCDARKIGRTANMLAKLNLKGFGDQMIQAIGKYKLCDLINLDVEYLAPRIGEGNAANFIALMNRLKTEPIYDYQIVGALGFSGIAGKTWKIIFSNYDYREVLESITQNDGMTKMYLQKFNDISGIGASTIETIINEVPNFIDDIRLILSMPNVRSSKSLGDALQIRFSGCRDLQLEEQLIKEGYDADSSSGVTKKTNILIVPYAGYSSTKTRKMSESSVIVPIDEFKSNMQLYLS